jgi:hypothetical protein
VEHVLEFLDLALTDFLVLMEVVLGVTVSVVLVIKLLFQVMIFNFHFVVILLNVSHLVVVVLNTNMHCVNVNSHSVLFFNSVLPLFDHTVFSFEINVSLVFKKTDSFFKFMDSVLIEIMHALHVVIASFHNIGV